MASITITRSFTRQPLEDSPARPAQERQAYWLKVEAVSAEGLDKGVFVFKRVIPRTAPGIPAAPVDTFECVADPIDLDEFPRDTPDTANGMPYYRLAVAELGFRSFEELESTYDLIREDIDGLVAAVASRSHYPDTETETISHG